MRVDVNGRTVSLPDFLVIGAARSGTTSLFYLLRRHPGVFMPDLKEPFYLTFAGETPPFTDLDFLRDRDWTIDDYSSLFDVASEGQLLGEASTSYLYMHRATIANIERLYGPAAESVRYMAVLRNPIDRTYSNYLLLRSSGWDDLSFDEYLDVAFTRERMKRRWDYDYVGLGRYAEGIAAYKRRFPHVFVALYEDLSDQRRLLREIFAFLGLQPIVPSDNGLQANSAGTPRSHLALSLLNAAGRLASPLRSVLPYTTRMRLAMFRESIRRRLLHQPEISANQRARLASIFRDDVLELQDIIDRDLSSWLEEPDRTRA